MWLFSCCTNGHVLVLVLFCNPIIFYGFDVVSCWSLVTLVLYGELSIVVCLRLTCCTLHVEKGEEWDHDEGCMDLDFLSTLKILC